MEIQPDLSLCLLPGEAGVDLAPCLQALLACADPLALEIFLPRDAELGAVFDSPRLHFLDMPAKPAPAFVKAAWQLGRGRYLGLWQGGVRAAGPATLTTLVEFLDDHPDVAAAGPRFFNEQGAILATAFGRRALLPLADPLMPGWDGLATMEVDWLSSGALVINSLAVADITLPGTNLGGNWERALCRRLQAQGWHIFFVHLARVVARHGHCRPLSFWQRRQDDWQHLLAALSLRGPAAAKGREE